MVGAKDMQAEAFDKRYSEPEAQEYLEFLDTEELGRAYFRDRLIHTALDRLQTLTEVDLEKWTVLVVCGGVGREATQLRRYGFRNIVNSDYSPEAVRVSVSREPDMEHLRLDAEAIDFADGSFDLVLVQAGLHHLPRPVTGLNEMLRVARRAAIVIEPHTGLLANLLGMEFEEEHGEKNYVFRWNHHMLTQSTRSQLLEQDITIETIRMLFHSKMYDGLERVVRGNQRSLLRVQQAIDGSVGRVVGQAIGNTFVGLVVKNSERTS